MLFALASLATAACGSDAAVVVQVQGELEIPGQIDSICLSITDADSAGGMVTRHKRLADVGDLPQSLAVEPGNAQAATAMVRGYVRSMEVDRASQRFDFAASGAGEVVLTLDGCSNPGQAAPAIASSVPVAADAVLAASAGRGGTLLVAVSVNGTSVYQAGELGLTTVQSAAPLLPVGAQVTSVVPMDVDRDCDDDLLITMTGYPPVLWMRNFEPRMSPYFAEVPLDPAVGPALAAAAVDIDSDGAVDLVLGLRAAPFVSVLRNDGAGILTVDPSRIVDTTALTTEVIALALGDITGDGQLDIIAAQAGPVDPNTGIAPGAPLVALTGQDGYFTPAVGVLPDAVVLARALHVVDVTGDGASDLLAAVDGSPVRLLVNRSGRLEDRTAVLAPTQEPGNPASLVLADWDGDCASDVLVAATGARGATLARWRMAEGRLLSEPDATLASLIPVRASIADIDDDGDMDVLVVSSDGMLHWVSQ